jgi:hypothetical protein
MTSPSEPSRQDIDDQLREMLKYLRLGRLLAHWEETLQKARQGRYVEVEPAQVGQFFTLMHKRHQRKTTIITSNLGFSEWGSFLKNPQLTAALNDRLTSNSHVINMKDCDSLRDCLDK